MYENIAALLLVVGFIYTVDKANCSLAYCSRISCLTISNNEFFLLMDRLMDRWIGLTGQLENVIADDRKTLLILYSLFTFTRRTSLNLHFKNVI